MPDKGIEDDKVVGEKQMVGDEEHVTDDEHVDAGAHITSDERVEGGGGCDATELFCVQDRVTLPTETGLQGGMVADVSDGTVEVALDNCSWLDIQRSRQLLLPSCHHLLLDWWMVS